MYEPTIIAQKAQHDPPPASKDLGRHQNEGVKEAPVLHAHHRRARSTFRHHLDEPGLRVPGQGRDHHVGPVGEKVVHRHPQRVDAVLQLLDVVLVVSAPVGKKHRLVRPEVFAVGDVKKIAHLVEGIWGIWGRNLGSVLQFSISI